MDPISDQAQTLRKLMRQRRTESSHPMPRVLTFASGKGGTGKTSLVANLGTALARGGQRVLLIDADMGLANLDILLGVQTQATLEEVLDGRATIQEAIVGVEPGLWLIPAGSGLMDYREQSVDTRERLVQVLDSLPWEMDLILIDVGAGIQENVISVHHPEFESVIVMTPEPTSLTDAYSLMKILRKRVGVQEFGLVVNQVQDIKDAAHAYRKVKDVAQRFINVEVELLGHCVRDENFTQAVMKRKILLDWDTGAAPSLELLSKRLKSRVLPRFLPSFSGLASQTGLSGVGLKDGNMMGFWRTLLG